ncbi:MAG: hypothetical protein Q8R15_03725 [Candidatus Micrarchaeota archaeon]|nr:hypothetical protein [Candidatus Micrarchaeota archaeon]
MKRELIYGIFAILSTFVLSFITFIFMSNSAITPYAALFISLVTILLFTHFYFKQRSSQNTNVTQFSLVMLGTTVILYALTVGIVAGKGISFIYSSLPFWITAIESIAVPFTYAKLVKRNTETRPTNATGL